MTEHKSIYAALSAAQAEFGQIKKGSINPAYKSSYATLSDVASVVIPTLSTHGVAVLHYFVNDGIAMRTEFYHAATATRVWCDVPLIVDRQNMQGMKSAVTYSKRIGLESLSGIAPEDDDGNAAAAAKPTKPIKPMTEDQIANIIALAEEVGYQGDIAALKKRDASQYDIIIAGLEKKRGGA